MIAVINNMHARKNRTGLFCKKTLSGVLGSHSIIFDTRSLEEVERAIEEILSRNVKILCVNGGDGSMQIVVTTLLNKTKDHSQLPYLVPMRGGTMNMICKNVGVNGNPFSVAERLAEKYRRFRTGYDGMEFREFRVISVRSNLFEGSKFTFCFANGTAFKILKRYYASGEYSPQKAFNIVTSIIGGFIIGSRSSNYFFEHTPAKITIDNKPYPYSEILLSVASSYPRLVLWFSPYYQSDRIKERGGFHFFAISMDNWEVIKNIRALSRGEMKAEESYNDLAENVRMEFGGGFTLDGEVFDGEKTSSVELSMGPLLKFIRV